MNGSPVVYYIYPTTKWVSFRIIAEEHIRQIQKQFYVQKVDETALATILPMASLSSRSVIFLHPYFYPIQVYERRLLSRIGKIGTLIGVDVADSDHITETAVRLTEHATAMIVPSNFSRKTYVDSGVKTPVHVIPHGVHESYIDAEPSKPNIFEAFHDYKARTMKKLMQIWVLHSSYRKGEDLAYKIFNILVKERMDVALVVRRPLSIDLYDSPINPEKLTPKITIGKSYLTDEEIKELMDICDIFLLASRGGGFEHPPLLGMARGEIVIAAKGGAWEDYMPEWGLVQSQKSETLLPGNPIHDGRGVEMIADYAVAKIYEILNNMDEYRAKTKEHVEKHIKPNFTWDKIGQKLRELTARYLHM
jgi:glycosyltransferase involved in cell wall biosynthesis